MTVEAFDAPGALRRLIADGAITEEALRTITAITQGALRSFIQTGRSENGLVTTEQELSAEESARLSILAAQLTAGMAIPDDERLRGILESLAHQLRLTPQGIAQLAGLDAGDVEKALSDPQSISVQKKYSIAIRASYLVNAFNQAQP